MPRDPEIPGTTSGPEGDHESRPLAYYRVTLAYDGTDFEGWQSQARGRTVQDVLEEALGRLSDGARVKVAGAGRTDAGTHALGQVTSFALGRDLDPKDLVRALNGLLPEDVRALDAARVDASFHARKSARAKLYRYTLDTRPVQLPTRRRFAGHMPGELDRLRVAAAATLYRGRLDFASLASAGGSVRTTERTVVRSEVRWDDHGLVYEVEADGFLRKMVRSMVGGLVAAGRGVTTIPDLRRALDARDRQGWPAPVQARGLVLVRVLYEGDR